MQQTTAIYALAADGYAAPYLVLASSTKVSQGLRSKVFRAYSAAVIDSAPSGSHAATPTAGTAAPTGTSALVHCVVSGVAWPEYAVPGDAVTPPHVRVCHIYRRKWPVLGWVSSQRVHGTVIAAGGCTCQ